MRLSQPPRLTAQGLRPLQFRGLVETQLVITICFQPCRVSVHKSAPSDGERSHGHFPHHMETEKLVFLVEWPASADWSVHVGAVSSWLPRPPHTPVAGVRGDRRQLVLPVATTIFAGRYGVIIRYGGTVDYRPTSQANKAETHGRQDTGNGSGQGWDERAFSAASGRVAHCRRRRKRSIGGAPGPIPSTGCGRMRSSRCYGMIRLAS